MIKRLFVLSMSVALAATASTTLAATCGGRDSLTEQLQAKFSEQLTAGGLQDAVAGKAVMEIWASEETGTFTVLLTHANGLSCIVAAGTDFFKATPAAAPDGTAS